MHTSSTPQISLPPGTEAALSQKQLTGDGGTPGLAPSFLSTTWPDLMALWLPLLRPAPCISF